MPAASTLHKSAQQGAPDAYISLCKSTTQDTCVQKMPASTPIRASKRCPRRPHTRVEDTRAAPLCVHTKMHAPPPYARLRHTRVDLLLRALKMAAPTWTRAKMHA